MSLCIGFDEDKVHALYPEASMIKAMDIWSLPKNKRDNLEEYCNSGKYLASVKKDGYFYSLNRTPQFTYLFSRRKGVNGFLTEKSMQVPHIGEAAQTLPPDTLLIGEIYIPGKTSKAVTGIMGCLPAKAILRQKTDGNVHYLLNDIVTLNGEDLRDKPFEERIAILTELHETYFSNNEFIHVAVNIDTDIYETAKRLLDEGEEGMVLKKKDSLYICDKRPAWSSIKIKQEDTLDVVITGFCDPTKEYQGTELEAWQYWWVNDLEYQRPLPTEEAKGESFLEACNYGFYIPVTKAYYFGWKNAIEVSAYDGNELKKIGTISSGLTDKMREDFAKNPEKYLNRVIEIKCMSIDNEKHSIRHGYFLKFREDKNPEDCTFDVIFN